MKEILRDEKEPRTIDHKERKGHKEARGNKEKLMLDETLRSFAVELNSSFHGCPRLLTPHAITRLCG
jgi:hypothetical protein